MAGGMHAGETAAEVGGTHPTGIHCFSYTDPVLLDQSSSYLLITLTLTKTALEIIILLLLPNKFRYNNEKLQ